MAAIDLLAVDPEGLGGMAIRAQTGPVRERLLALLPGRPRKMPASIADDALLGGLDLAATLQSGKPVTSRGLLEEARGGMLIAAMAERLPAALAGRLAASLDAAGGVALVMLDEGIAPDEQPPPALLDRVAFHLDLTAISHRETRGRPTDEGPVEAARTLLPDVSLAPGVLEALCETAQALGIASVRAPLLAVRAARAAASLAGRLEANLDDAALAARLVLSPRATIIPAPQPEDASEDAPEDAERADPPPPDNTAGADSQDSVPDSEIPGKLSEASEIVLEAARAALPADLLARVRARDFRGSARSQGNAGARQKGSQRGRPVGVRSAPPGPGVRMNLVETLRAAAPWQRIRGQDDPPGRFRLHLRREDFRVVRTEQRMRSITIFVVDASGSAALNRLAEAKGAVELLLADCYRRRDQVAVLAFRGRSAQLLLPPTRSLVRAKRSLATLPGGGGTPLAAGIDAGLVLAETLRRGGCTPTIVLLTDGRANVTRAGSGGRAQAGQEAVESARRLRASGITALFLDTSPRPATEAGALAKAMGALYIPLPYANAAGVSRAVRMAGLPA